MDDVTSPVLAQARDVGQVVDEPGGDDEAAGVELPAEPTTVNEPSAFRVAPVAVAATTVPP